MAISPQKLPKYLVNLAGEFRVCSELNRRGVFATITYGNRKGADVYAISDRKSRSLRIEVKTTQAKEFVTGLTPSKRKDEHAPDFWVLFQLYNPSGGSSADRFFILDHKELCAAQQTRDDEYSDSYFKKHGKKWEDPGTGPYVVQLVDIEKFADKWEKIITAIGGPELE